MESSHTKLDHPRRPFKGSAFLLAGWLLAGMGLACLVSNMFLSLGGIGFLGLDFNLPGNSIYIVLIVGMFLIGAGGALIKKGRRLTAPTAETLLTKDQRPPVLLLRAFVDDELVVEARNYGKVFFSERVTLEEAISPVLSTIGPVIAIGRPGESASPLGAAREYVSHETWTHAVESWIDRASRVVMIMGSLANQKGLSWELRKIQEFACLHKLILVLPPEDTETASQRWREYEAFLGVKLPPFTGVELFVAFDGDLKPLVKTAKNVGKASGRAERYSASLKAFLQEIK